MKTLLLEYSYKHHKTKINITVPSFVWNWKTKTLDKHDKSLEVMKWQKGNDSDKIKQWVHNNKNRFDIEINNDESSSIVLAIDIEDDYEKQVEDSLYDSGIRFSKIK